MFKKTLMYTQSYFHMILLQVSEITRFKKEELNIFLHGTKFIVLTQ